MARGPVFGVLVASLTGGIILGLVIAWGLWPVEFTDADPVDLRAEFKDDYVRMISAAYELDGNLARAQLRLSLLGLGDLTRFNRQVARERQVDSRSRTLTAMTDLARALSTPPTPSRPGGDSTSGSNWTAVAIPTLPIPAYRLSERTPLTCLEQPGAAALKVYVRDRRGADQPNVAVEIRWANGDETVYTGLKPERGVGYADYEAVPNTYAVTILNAQSDTANDLIVGDPPSDCNADDGATPRGWKLVFQQP
jgi:hypothetical protein